jgi:hypothetical protein
MVIKSRRITWAMHALYVGYKSLKNLAERGIMLEVTLKWLLINMMQQCEFN